MGLRWDAGAPLPILIAGARGAVVLCYEFTRDGQTRTILLADGGSLHQAITSIDRPHSHAYVLDEIHGRPQPFVRSVEGLWSIPPKGAGAQVGCAWTLHPKVSPARLTRNLIGRMWRGYADRALVELETILMRG